MSIPVNLEWAFSKNERIIKELKSEYPLEHGYWQYLDELITTLRNLKCGGIEGKLTDVDNLYKLRSATSELEIARLLCERRKQVELLEDSFIHPAPSPDIYVKDLNGEYYVEVAHFSDDQTIEIILNELGKYLKNLSQPCQVNVTLSSELSTPAIDTKERGAKDKKIHELLIKLKSTLESHGIGKLPFTLIESGCSFNFTETSNNYSFVGIINFSFNSVPSGKFAERIKFLLTDKKQGKAYKRTKWTGDDLKKYYIVAINCDQPFLYREEVAIALLGQRESYSFYPPKRPIPQEVLDAEKKGWSRFLEKQHLIPKGRTVFKAYDGVFLTDPICKNLSGVLVYKEMLPHSSSAVYFTPNPFAEDVINNPKVAKFL